jgi:hypothetical protein
VGDELLIFLHNKLPIAIMRKKLSVARSNLLVGFAWLSDILAIYAFDVNGTMTEAANKAYLTKDYNFIVTVEAVLHYGVFLVMPGLSVRFFATFTGSGLMKRSLVFANLVNAQSIIILLLDRFYSTDSNGIIGMTLF